MTIASKLRKAAFSTLAVAALAGGGVVLGATSAQAAPCGYSADSTYAYYNHCGSGNAYIQVDQVVGNYGQCVGPGTTILRNNTNQGLYTITNAFYLRPC